MKCIFIVLDSGTAIRNILRTDVFSLLKEKKDLQVVVFSPVTDEEFKKEFTTDNVLIEPNPHWKANPLVAAIRSIKKDLWAENTKVFTFGQKRAKKEGRFLRRIILKRLRGLLPQGKMERVLDRLEGWFTPDLKRGLFEKYRPDLVFYTTIFSKDPCLEIAAEKRGLKTVCFVMSWDNLTSKGPFRFRPERVVVWNEILKEELSLYHGISKDKVFVAGIPQFDIYSHTDRFRPKEEFFRKWGLDPAKKLITYTTGTPGTAPFDNEVVQLLYDAFAKNSFALPSQLLIRLHPKDNYKYYKSVEGKPGLVIQMPGRAAKTNDGWNPTVDDMYGLAELMHYSDVVVNVASTITIDAAAFDTPVVNVAFDGFTDKPYKDSCKRYYDYEHYRNIVATGGIRIACSAREMVEWVDFYLKDPSADAEGRRRIREEQCWRLDGNAGKRIASYVLHYLDKAD